MFSSLKVIKTERRTSLKNQTLNDLLEIKVEGPPLCQFSADQAIDLWFSDGGIERRWKKRTSSHKKRAQPQEGCSSAIPVESESEDETMWDKWFDQSEDDDQM